MSHKVVMEEPRLMGARGQPGPEGERSRANATARPAQIGADIAKNDRGVQRLRPFHDNAAERSFLTVP